MPSAVAEEEDRRRWTGRGRRVAHLPDDNLRGVETETAAKQLYICSSCGFIYDPDDGDPDGGIPPGTAFTDIPDDWYCPVCGARKSDFSLFED